MRKIILSALVCLIALSSAAQAATKLVATFKITPTVATYRIPLKNCGQDLNQVKLRISGSGVFMQEIGVVLSDKSVKSYPANATFSANQEGDWMDMAPFRGMGCVAQVFAVGKSTSTQNAKLEVFGDFK